MTSTQHTIISVLPLRDIVVFPGMVVPLFVGREKSVKALDHMATDDNRIMLVTQKDGLQDDPSLDDVYEIGTIAQVLQLLRLPDGTVKVLVEGKKRARIVEAIEGSDFYHVTAELIEENEPPYTEEQKALIRSAVSHFEEYVKLNKKLQPETVSAIHKITTPAELADTLAAHIQIDIAAKQKILETLSAIERLEYVYSLMESEISVMNTEKRIRTRVKKQMEKTQREYYLNEQMKAIQKELGEIEEGKDEIGELEERLKNAKMSKEAQEKAKSELKKLRSMNMMSAEASVIRNYLDWLASLPWAKKSRISHDTRKAIKILDQDHYGLDKVKERVIEYLAVHERTKDLKGPILCLVGPPGVGKTSLAKSIARATGRQYIKISLGGVRDESEIRGHRRTYIGSMPGKIIQSMKKAKANNPLILLDEIDKMSNDFRGDPAAALLEVLDPEQNSNFNDHYLEVDYDLSDVMFIATANSMNMPRPLMDRMEIIRIPGYTEEEKINIAQNYIITKKAKDHGLHKDEWQISTEALRDMIRYYTREAGVRGLEREIASLARKTVRKIVTSKQPKKVQITARNLGTMLGVRKYSFGQAEHEDVVGMTTGLAYTEAGGDLLTIEAVTIAGKSKITYTGKLGDVMQESVQAAYSYVRSRAPSFGIKEAMMKDREIHIHVPEGATPKDGPSAGIAMCTTMISVLTGIPVKRSVAMTGEVTLRGRVLAIGGLKEKLLAALRGGITTVLIPAENEKDLEEIPEHVKRGLNIICVSHVDEVLIHALAEPIVPIEWEVVHSEAAALATSTSESTVKHH
ncbi:MAG: endopeptidase La [Alphaproteobacteria bacterium]|nr:MAG: endopeptidase La [Alphaproteobacteria bacterium]